jgi:F-type H+-transporting ATPase subunit alpha
MLVLKLIENVPVNKVKNLRRDFLEFLNNKHKATLDALKAGKLTDRNYRCNETAKRIISKI